MINFIFTKTLKNIKQVEISGHANFGKLNEDIVCAAVSSAAYVSINLIKRFELNEMTELVLEDGYINLKITEENEIINKILENLEYTLNDLLTQYPKYISNKKEG